MDDLNKEIIDAKKRLIEIDKIKKELEVEYNFLSDKIHLYFDSSKNNTKEAEDFIMNYFWQNAYDKKTIDYLDKNNFEDYVNYKYICNLFDEIINKYCQKKTNALEIGCGDGRFVKHFAKHFDEVVGVDLSQKAIDICNENNTIKNVKYICENALNINVDIGKFDFIYVSYIFMYTHDSEINDLFESLLRLLSDDGVLVTYDTVYFKKNKPYKSKNYIANYRNFNFYSKGLFENYFITSYRSDAYLLLNGNLKKYFNVNKNMKDKVIENPMLLKEIVDEYIDENEKVANFFVYKK